jgi:hypothetical protein
MRKFGVCCLFTIVALLMFTGAAYAQSTGNFSASATAASCSIGANGSLSGGAGSNGLLETKISTSSGNGVYLDIRPSLVTGLFTDTKINNQITTATADVGITVCVEVDGSGAGIVPASCVNYDERFQQISSNLFTTITTCGASTVCTVNSDCVTGDTCYNPSGTASGGTCIGVPTATVCTTTADCTTAGLLTDICDNPTGAASAGLCAPTAPQSCSFELILSTLSAHSFDYVIGVNNKKPHDVLVTWATTGSASSGANIASCVGPGIVTVTQEKVFNNSGAVLTF